MCLSDLKLKPAPPEASAFHFMAIPSFFLLNLETLNLSSSCTPYIAYWGGQTKTKKKKQVQTEGKEVEANFMQDYCNKGKETPV